MPPPNRQVMRYALCYVSTSNKDLNHQQVEKLLQFTQNRNESLKINGILLFSDGNFFQILEGEKQVVLSVFEKIKNDPRHHGLIQIIGRDIEQGTRGGYQTDIITENFKHNLQIPLKFIETLDSMPLNTGKPMKRMLTMFINN